MFLVSTCFQKRNRRFMILINDRLLKHALASHHQRRRIHVLASYCAAWSAASGVWRSSSSSSTGTLTSWWAQHVIVHLFVPPILIVTIIVVVIIKHLCSYQNGKTCFAINEMRRFSSDYHTTVSPSLNWCLIECIEYYLYYVDHFIFLKECDFFVFFVRLPFTGKTSASQLKMLSCCSWET